MVDKQRKLVIGEEIAHLAAEFLGAQSNRQSMITVTRADVAPSLSNAVVYFTVFPQEAEEHALDFVLRKRTEFRTFVKSRTRLRRLPFFDFKIDEGEKNRQELDRLSQ